MPSTAEMSAAAKAFFEQWRRDRRESQQQTCEEETPSKTSSVIKSAISPFSSLQSGSEKSPANATSPNAKSPESATSPRKSAKVESSSSPRMLPRAPPSSSKPARHVVFSPVNKNATRAQPADDESDRSHQADAGDLNAVRDQIETEQPPIWDPPFATTPRAQAKTPTRALNPRRSRAGRRSSPILNAKSEDDVGEDANGDAQPDTGGKKAGAKAKGVTDKKYSLTSISAHRPKPGEPNLFQLLVRWASPADGPVETWEPEENIHHDAPRVLFAYWRRVGGREEYMKDPTLWFVEGVKNHRLVRGRVELSVSWVGSPDVNWEPEGRVVDIAPTVVADYWEGKGGRDGCVGGAKKRKGGAAKKVAGKKARKS